MSPKADVSQKRKTQILEAAMETFSKVGFHKARMSDIAEKSGLSKGSLYLYFESKNDLILHLLARVFEPEIKDLRSLLDVKKSVEERLLIYAERGAKDIIDMLKWMPLVYDFIALAFRQNNIREAISLYYQQNMAILETLIQQGIDSGEIRTSSARDAAIAIGSILEGTIVLWFYDPNEIEIRTHLMTNIKLLIQGLKPQPASPG
jgi:AcrR family transcriptional regulator